MKALKFLFIFFLQTDSFLYSPAVYLIFIELYVKLLSYTQSKRDLISYLAIYFIELLTSSVSVGQYMFVRGGIGAFSEPGIHSSVVVRERESVSSLRWVFVYLSYTQFFFMCAYPRSSCADHLFTLRVQPLTSSESRIPTRRTKCKVHSDMV